MNVEVRISVEAPMPAEAGHNQDDNYNESYTRIRLSGTSLAVYLKLIGNCRRISKYGRHQDF